MTTRQPDVLDLFVIGGGINGAGSAMVWGAPFEALPGAGRRLA